MALVAATFLHLAQVAKWPTLVGQHHGHKIANKLIATVVQYGTFLRTVLICSYEVIFVEAHSLVIHVNIIAENSDAHHT